jgi:sulfite reductase alpha subunit-like flavoprotein
MRVPTCVPALMCAGSFACCSGRVELQVSCLFVPRRYFFELLAAFASDAREAMRLKELSSPEGLDDLLAYCTRVRRTSLEVLEDFKSAQQAVPVGFLLELFRPIQPRAFSISSASEVHPGEVHLTVAVVQFATRMSTPRVGLCSSWLATLAAGTDLPMWVCRGSFKLPSDDLPLVMVGPGTLFGGGFLACL